MFFLFFRAQFCTNTMGSVGFEQGCNEQENDPFVVHIVYVLIVAGTSRMAKQRKQEVVGRVDHEDACEDEEQVGQVHHALQTAHVAVAAFVHLHALDDAEQHGTSRKFLYRSRS